MSFWIFTFQIFKYFLFLSLQNHTNSRPIYDDTDQGSSLRKSNAERFRFCNKFVFTCQACKKPNPVPEPFRTEQNRKISVFEKCINAECTAKPTTFGAAIVNELILAVRAVINRFYENWLVCDDPLCSSNTKITTHVTDKGKPICTVCKKGILIRQFSEKELFNQLDYFKFLLNLKEKDINGMSISSLQSIYFWIPYDLIFPQKTMSQLMFKSCIWISREFWINL